MNLFLIVIVSAILLEFTFNNLSRYLNLRRLDINLPPEFRGFYNAEKYARSQNYTRAKSRFGFIVSSFSVLVLLAVIFFGGFDYIDQFLRSLGYSPLVTGLLFFGTLILIQDVISTPFDIFHTFVIEENFDFNKSRPLIYIADKAKTYLLMLVLGAPVLAVILYLFEVLSNAWLYVWAFATFLTVLTPKVFTQFISPLFNSFTPLESGSLRSKIENYAATVSFPLSEIYIMDGSRRSGHSNAYFTGFGRTKRIVLFDTLLSDHTNDEILAILAHEVGHYKKYHVIKGMLLSTIHTGIMLFVLQFFFKIPELHQAFGMTSSQPSTYAGLVFFSLLYSPLELVLSIFFNYISRKHEFEADQFSAHTLQNAEALISGLKNLAVKNLSNLTPHPLSVFLSFSHPPVLERILALQQQFGKKYYE